MEHLLPSIHLNPAFRLFAAASRREKIRLTFSRGHDCMVFESWEDLVADPNVDAIICAGPPNFNERVVEKAIDLVKPIFTEKPCSNSTPILTKLAENESKAGSLVQVGYNFLFSDGFLSLMQKENEFGPIMSMDICFLTNKPRSPLWLDDDTFRSFLYAIAIHPIAMALHMFRGTPRHAIAVQAIRTNQFDVRVQFRDETKTVNVETGNHSDRFEYQFRAIYQSGETVHFNSSRPNELALVALCQGESKSAVRMQRVIQRISLPGQSPDRDGRGYERELASFAHFARNREANGLQLVNSLAIHALLEQIFAEKGDR